MKNAFNTIFLTVVMLVGSSAYGNELKDGRVYEDQITQVWTIKYPGEASHWSLVSQFLIGKSYAFKFDCRRIPSLNPWNENTATLSILPSFDLDRQYLDLTMEDEVGTIQNVSDDECREMRRQLRSVTVTTPLKVTFGNGSFSIGN